MPKLRAPYAVLTVLYCTGIFLLSSQSDPQVPKNEWLDIPGVDKAAHAVLYGGLAFVVSWGLRRSDAGISPGRQFWLPILFAAAYGVTDEIHQWFVPNRELDFWDWVADTGGAAAVQWVLCVRMWRLDMGARSAEGDDT